MSNLFFSNYIVKYKLTKLTLLFIILLGVAIRLFHFLYNRSLWMDEIYLCSSFLHMDYIKLATTELDYGQKAPIGFLWMVKSVLDIFGNSEFALRTVPFIAGIISLFMYRTVCKYFLGNTGQIIAVAIFSFAPAIIYHSVEIKQYSTECLATVLALYLFVKYRNNDKWTDNLLWGIIGAILLWFSYSVFFILAGIAAGVSFNCFLNKRWKSLFFYLQPFSIWMISFIVIMLCFTNRNTDSDWVVYFFKVYDNFMPFPPSTIQEFKWFPRNFIGMMDYPLGLSFPFIPSILLLSGFISIYTDRQKFFTLVFPILLTLVASGLYLYPLIERFWVFLAPILLIIIASGYEYYELKIKSLTFKILLCIMTIISPVLQSFYFVLTPEKFYKHKKSFERESLLFVNEHFKNGDCVYNYWNNSPGYSVYKSLNKFKYDAIEGKDLRKESKNLDEYNNKLELDFKKFHGRKRVWVIYNNQFLTDIGDKIDDPKWYYKNKFTPNENLIYQLCKIGSPVQKIVFSDVTIYLFDLNPPLLRNIRTLNSS